MPYLDENGFITGLQKKSLGGKYLTARGSLLSSVYHLAGTGSPGQDLYVTEGATKATVASHLGKFWTFAIAGQSLTSQHVDVIIGLRAGRVIVALDQEDNLNTDRARERWCGLLYERRLPVFTAVWDGEELDGAKGLDDLLFRGEYPRVEPLLQVPLEANSASGMGADITLFEMQSEIGKFHMGPGEVRHGGGEWQRQESVAPTVIQKNRLYRMGDEAKNRGKRPSLWKEAKGHFPLPTHVKPRTKGYMLWSGCDSRAIAVDLYSNTWRNPVNAQFKRQKLYYNIFPRINGPQIYRCRVPIDDWNRTVHGRIKRAIQRAILRAETEDHGWIWIDNALDHCCYLYLTSTPGLAGFEPVEDVRLILIDALKSIHPPDRDDGKGRFRPYGGSKNWVGKAEDTGEEDANRWEIIAVSNRPTDFVGVEVECVVSGVETEYQSPFWRAQPFEGLAMRHGSKEAAVKFALLFPEVYTLTKAALADLQVSVGAKPDHAQEQASR